MESTIVCGAMHFVGFEICKELLNRGCSVIAIDNEEQAERFHLEKWLEIGRNANLMRLSIEEIRDEIDSETVCFIPFIDFLRSSEKMNDLLNTVENLIQMENITEYHIIYPSQYYHSFSDMDKSKLHTIFQKNNRIKKVVEYYAPTLYGPWQPNTYLFQQLIEGKPTDDYLDDQRDAIFIEDAVKEIVGNTKATEHGQSLLLRNVQSDTWRNCILFLNESFSMPDEKKMIDNSDIQIINVKEQRSYQEGLIMQMECFKRFYE
ncbi:hypothetical protein NSQ59_18770 [Margalitia sp. FSL K6-0131]|uniref:hypothetical protein n=1 Tax=Margalitia sp. FSL K6-0131 TaxID=2954604 RepID=UPI0030F577AC